MTTYFPPLIYKAGNHQPMGDGEQLAVGYLPLSQAIQNAIQASPDGLYVGPAVGGRRIFYVSPDGTDNPESGSKDNPLKTLAYCHSLLLAMTNGQFQQSVTIALKAGETFPTAAATPFYCMGHITYTFWGDPQYGDFDSPLVAGTNDPATMADLSRPVIQSVMQTSTTGQSGVVLAPNAMNAPTSCTLHGVRVDLLGGAHASGYVDFVTGLAHSQSTVRLIGTVINMTDVNSEFGFYGLDASARGYLYQFASQFWINGAPVQAGASTAALTARKNFLKFYPDFTGNHQQGLELHTGAPGSALMGLSWSDIESAPVLPGKSSLGTWPLLNNTGFGLANYFFNLNRDQQGRPLNVQSGRLF